MRRLRHLHPLLFAAFPVASLLASNLGQLYPSEAARSLAVALVGAALLTALGRAVLGDWDRSALIVSMTLLVFFAYGHVYGVLEGFSLGGILIGRHRYLVPLSLGLIAAWAWWAARRLREPGKAAAVFSVVGGIALMLPMYTIGAYYLVPPATVRKTGQETLRQEGHAATRGHQPDIYYIILDGYGREDVLRDLYDFDNSEFIRALEQRGFFVASGAYSNYLTTVHSLASSLNMQYLDDVAAQMAPGSTDLRPLSEMIIHSKVRSFLEEHGYQMVAFESGWPLTEVRDAAFFLSAEDNHLTPDVPLWAANEFEIMLLRSSMMRPVTDSLQSRLLGEETPFQWPYLRHRDRILFALRTMKEIPAWEGDYFVFAHILIPHPPFVFGPSGEFLPHTRAYGLDDGSMFDGTLEEYVGGYRDQVTYVNRTIVRLVDALLSRSEPAPVIILQADHGPKSRLVWEDPEGSNLREVFAIFSAYYLPWEGPPRPSESVTPVNSFRILLNGLFGEDMGLLPDESYFANYAGPYRFLRVTDRVITD